jgi:plasmid stability protein
MGQLLVRDLDDEVIRRLKQRAASNKRSVEAEHRAILSAAVESHHPAPVMTARRFLSEFAEPVSDSAETIRHYRDERGR